jgi:hypothetical protein
MFYLIAKIVGFVAIAFNATLLLGLFGLALGVKGSGKTDTSNLARNANRKFHSEITGMLP